MSVSKKSFLGILVVVYLITAGASFAGMRSVLAEVTNPSAGGDKPSRFASLISPLVPTAGKGAVDVDAGAPKTEACPLNGKMYTVAERESWEKRTPLAVMIENHTEARPQSGLSAADVVYEAVAEGGITRFMAMVYCDAQDEDILMAPIRSARTYFIDWASSYQEPLYTHVGGANLPGPANALGQLDDYGWVGANDLNQFSIGFPTFARNYDRVTLADGKALATEHTMETSSERLWKYAADNREITVWDGAKKFQPWTFKDDAEQKGSKATIRYDFWEGYKDFAVAWNFDAGTNTYARVMADQPHVDLNTGEQIKVKNVVIMFTTEKGPIDEAKHMLYTTTGSGKALIFQDGEVIDGTWNKSSRTGALTFKAKGKDVALNRGLTWISVLATGAPVNY